jgi:ribonuclease HIII
LLKERPEEIIPKIKKEFPSIYQTSPSGQGVSHRFEIVQNGNKIAITFYLTGKCLVQGPDGVGFEFIKQRFSGFEFMDLVCKREVTAETINEREIFKKRQFIIGLDEAGIGETIGPGIFAAVVLGRDQLSSFTFLKKDVKTLSRRRTELLLQSDERQRIKYDWVTLTASEINHSPFK